MKNDGDMGPVKKRVDNFKTEDIVLYTAHAKLMTTNKAIVHTHVHRQIHGQADCDFDSKF